MSFFLLKRTILGVTFGTGRGRNNSCTKHCNVNRFCACRGHTQSRNSHMDADRVACKQMPRVVRTLAARLACFGCSGMWCFRMWGLNILVSNPSPISAIDVKSPHLQFLRVNTLSFLNPTSSHCLLELPNAALRLGSSAPPRRRTTRSCRPSPRGAAPTTAPGASSAATSLRPEQQAPPPLQRRTACLGHADCCAEGDDGKHDTVDEQSVTTRRGREVNGTRHASLVRVAGCRNVTLTGRGEINGNGLDRHVRLLL